MLLSWYCTPSLPHLPSSPLILFSSFLSPSFTTSLPPSLSLPLSLSDFIFTSKTLPILPLPSCLHPFLVLFSLWIVGQGRSGTLCFTLLLRHSLTLCFFIAHLSPPRSLSPFHLFPNIPPCFSFSFNALFLCPIFISRFPLFLPLYTELQSLFPPSSQSPLLAIIPIVPPGPQFTVPLP